MISNPIFIPVREVLQTLYQGERGGVEQSLKRYLTIT